MVSSSDSAKLELVPVKKLKPDGGSAREESVEFVEQFVKDVVDFSSQYGSNISISYTAYNIAGNPSKFPDYGDFPQAFVMVIILRLYIYSVCFSLSRARRYSNKVRIDIILSCPRIKYAAIVRQRLQFS